MSDLIERLRIAADTGKRLRWIPTQTLREAADAIATKDREIAELRADCVRKDDHLLAAVQDYNEARQRTIEECAKVADAEMAKHNTGSGFDSQPAHSTAFAIATAIRSLGKEGSGE